MIRSATISDAAMIAAIYNHYVGSTTITFEEEAVDVDEMAKPLAPWARNCRGLSSNGMGRY